MFLIFLDLEISMTNVNKLLSIKLLVAMIVALCAVPVTESLGFM